MYYACLGIFHKHFESKLMNDLYILLARILDQIQVFIEYIYHVSYNVMLYSAWYKWVITLTEI